MTENWLNETVESVVNALEKEKIIIRKEEIFNFMYQYENIYQIVVGEYSIEKKTKLLIEELNRNNSIFLRLGSF